MHDCEFLLAKQSDISEILGLYRSLSGSPGCAWTRDYPDSEMTKEDIDNEALYIMKREGAIIAAGTLGEPDEIRHLGWVPKNPCELSRLGVVSTLQNQGIATMMLQKLIETAQVKGYDGAILLVSKSNPAAIALYEKNGFQRCGETHMWDVDFYCYQLVFLLPA